MIASSSKDTKDSVWDVILGVELLVMQGHKQGILTVVFSPDGGQVVSGSLDQTVRVWDATTGVQVFTELCGHKMEVSSVSFSEDASCIISQS